MLKNKNMLYKICSESTERLLSSRFLEFFTVSDFFFRWLSLGHFDRFDNKKQK